MITLQESYIKKREREKYNIIFTGRSWTEEVKTGLKVPLTSQICFTAHTKSPAALRQPKDKLREGKK